MEAFHRMMPDLYHETQVDSAGTPFASPQVVVDHMMPAMDALIDYAAVQAPALAIYHVPERAEGIFLGTLEQPTPDELEATINRWLVSEDLVR